ncbi:hypothetical protein BU23DRAFT_556166 [Bimuria novae-zelandiae CBS 107.79]|uniref:Uncharacterized protein n=1 Tax=Bimuria novae-zelandiae CBS 107.79 TaxID=1447943 RepID=A0A6A5V1M3_9PLEO|nr:hypothetical protein BU23DRAFT_556166 [Bimuria novae-zelandiae CBS 107.79]
MEPSDEEFLESDSESYYDSDDVLTDKSDFIDDSEDLDDLDNSDSAYDPAESDHSYQSSTSDDSETSSDWSDAHSPTNGVYDKSFRPQRSLWDVKEEVRT